MDSSGYHQKHKRAGSAEKRPSHSTGSTSHSQKSTKSPGRGSFSPNLPPIDTSGLKTPQKPSVQSSTRKSDFDSDNDCSKELESEGEFQDEEYGTEEALRALASYRAFQLTLLRQIADDPTFTEFPSQTQDSNTLSDPSFLFEDFVLDPALSTGTQPDDQSGVEESQMQV
jgi:hypothetical protein